MAHMRRFYGLQHSESGNQLNWGWCDVLNAVCSLSGPSAPGSFGVEERQLLDGIFTFFKECHGWLSKNCNHIFLVHKLMDSQGVLVTICRMCKSCLHHLQNFCQDLEQMPEDGIACVSLALGSLRYTVTIASLRAGCTAVEHGLPTVARAALSTGLLDEVCRASLAIKVTIKRHGGVLKRSYFLPMALLEVWRLLTRAWPDQLLQGNTIALTVPSITELAAAVLNHMSSSTAATGTSSGSAADTSSPADLHKASCSSTNSTRHSGVESSTSSRAQQKGKQPRDTTPLTPARSMTMMMCDMYQQDSPGSFNQQTRQQAIDVALHISSGYILAAVMSVTGSGAANRRQLERSAEFQRLLMISFGAWVDILHTQQAGRSPALLVWDGRRRQQQQQRLIVPPHHQQLLMSCGMTTEDMKAWHDQTATVPADVVSAAATAVVQVCSRSGGVASCRGGGSSSSGRGGGSRGSSIAANSSNPQQQQATLVVTLVSTLLEAAALVPTKEQLSLLPEVCSLCDKLPAEQRDKVSSGLLKPSIQLLLPMLQHLSTYDSSSSSVGISSTETADSSRQRRLYAAAAAQHLLRMVYFLGDAEVRVAVYQQQPADWCAAAEAWVRSVNYFQSEPLKLTAGCFQNLSATLVRLFFHQKAEDAPGAAGTSSDRQQQQHEAKLLGVLCSLSKAIAFLLTSGVLEGPCCLDLLQFLQPAVFGGMKHLGRFLRADGLRAAADAPNAADWLHLQGRVLHTSGKALSVFTQQQQLRQQQGTPTVLVAYMFPPLLCQVENLYQALDTMKMLGRSVQAADDAETAAAAAALAQAIKEQLRVHAQGLLVAFAAAIDRLELSLGGSSSSRAHGHQGQGRVLSASTAAPNAGQDIRKVVKQLQDRLMPITVRFQHQYQELGLVSIGPSPQQNLLPNEMMQVLSLDLANHLQQFGAAVCAALPVGSCCNNPGCMNLSMVSEQCLVTGRACVCSGCQTARYCGQDCQKAHWKAHKAACKQIQSVACQKAALLQQLSSSSCSN